MDKKHIEEIEAEVPVVDESQLLEYARSEGLVDESPGEEAAADDTPEADLSEAQQNEIMASMETILFMSDRPVGLAKLRSTLGREVPLSSYRALLARLRDEFSREHRGVEIAEVNGGFQLRTKPHMAPVLRKMVKTQPLRITGANMEVLSVIAYKQPCTKDEIDQIRGVDSGYVLRALMEKRLIRITGRSELPGRPMLYATTHEFLEIFSLRDVNSLPPLHEVEAMVAASEVGAEDHERAQLQDFTQMVEANTKILFDDSQIDEELDSLRAEIASIPTSTPFIEEQKAKEKAAAMGLTLDADGNIVPSPELQAAAAAAQAERHDEMIKAAVAEVQAESHGTESAPLVDSAVHDKGQSQA